MVQNERDAKRAALSHFEKALAEGDKLFRLTLIDDETVEVTDIRGGSTKHVNIACDNVSAMLLDILKQAGDWIL